MTVSRWERGLSRPRRAARAAIAALRGAAGAGPAGSAARPAAQPGGGHTSGQTAIDELVRIVGLEPALRALRRLVLLRTAPVPVRFPVDPATRLREVETALREQRELIARARIG